MFKGHPSRELLAESFLNCCIHTYGKVMRESIILRLFFSNGTKGWSLSAGDSPSHIHASQFIIIIIKHGAHTRARHNIFQHFTIATYDDDFIFLDERFCKLRSGKKKKKMFSCLLHCVVCWMA